MPFAPNPQLVLGMPIHITWDGKPLIIVEIFVGMIFVVISIMILMDQCPEKCDVLGGSHASHLVVLHRRKHAEK